VAGVTDSTSEYLARALEGDVDARAELLQRHVERLRAFVRPRLGARLRARETSQDVVQSVLREAWVGFDRLPAAGVGELDRSGFRRWLLRAADRKLKSRGRFWSRLRRSSAREEPGAGERIDELAAAGLATPSLALAAREELERIERAFARLPEDWREVLVLVRLEGLPHAEVARRLGRSESATRTLLSRALARLATELERDGPAG
jgi:RNA polymerase sigma-70 factor (ECF subfamily)